MTEKNKILEVKNLKQYFKVGRSTVKAVDDVSFDIYEGETFGLEIGRASCRERV